ncbi:DNA replication protein DnaD [Gracilibacillus halophilus YIM-C55.5]|uniref:DNA replication protein DnaD n=1 Tax=Gracilibacillus halophilus YIM-C55.5 TaxID=1308866 RepID=N4WW44_9BACI|nr:DnaD domain-containing protein [Gracilibacillus halophilus]ENH97311.1 DNA replication protein DnaD [Gracilibacillus halophilus YIM-C55.5]
MSEPSISSMLQNQLNLPITLFQKYSLLGLNEEQVMLLLQIYAYQQEGHSFPTPEQLAEHMTMSSEACSKELRYLIQRQFLSIEEENNDDIIKEYYSLEPLWQSLFRAEESYEDNTDQEAGEIFQRFEQEFGRPLSPFEIELVNSWIDEERIELSLIHAALREAVLMSKLNFKYIDRILLEWKRKGIKTVDQAKQASKTYHQHQTTRQTQQNHPYDKSLYYNWLEE